MGGGNSKDHYTENHKGKPHEYLVSSINPQTQQATPVKNESAYTILYLAICFGVILTGLITIWFWIDHKKKKAFRKEIEMREAKRKHQKEKAKKDLENRKEEIIRATGTESQSVSVSIPSVFTTTTVTEEVQPRNNNNEQSYSLFGDETVHAHANVHCHAHSPSHSPAPAPTIVNVEQNLANDREQFGHWNRHQHAPASPPRAHMNPSPVSSQAPTQGYPNLYEFREGEYPPCYVRREDLRQNASCNFESFVDNPRTNTTMGNNNSEASTGRSRPSLAREESFPFEHFGIPPEERDRRTTYVERQRPMSDFLRLSAAISFMEQDEEDSNEDHASRRRATNNTPTLPMPQPNNVREVRQNREGREGAGVEGDLSPD